MTLETWREQKLSPEESRLNWFFDADVVTAATAIATCRRTTYLASFFFAVAQISLFLENEQKLIAMLSIFFVIIQVFVCCTSNFVNKSWNTDLNHSSSHWIRSHRHLNFEIQLINSQKCLRLPNIVCNFLWIFIIVNKNNFVFIWKVSSTIWNYNNWLETISMRMNINVR